MLDPISLAAITTVLGTVGMGMANEAGKWAWESAGGLVRRIAGREVAAPTTAEQLTAVAQLVHERVRSDPQLAHAWSLFAQGVRMSGTDAGLGSHSGRPRLPASTRFFTDRQDALKLLDKEASRTFDGSPRVALLHGQEGMGTSTLAVHWGWRQADRFPDGQLYADLRGPGAIDTGAVLSSLLRQLGLPDEEIPPSAEDRIDRFRRHVADRRLLLVLDHAQSAAQIRPLLTSAPGVFTVVVTRRPFTGVDALPVQVGPLARRDAVRLLTDLVGKPAITAAKAALPSVLERCGGSPYALRAAAPRLSAPSVEVRPVPDRDPVRAAADDSYRLLPPEAARLYRLNGLYDWPAFDAAAAARAADIEESEAARLLEELADALLLERTDTGRYHYRPVVRAHAEAVAAATDGIAACSAAVSRTIEGYLHLAVGAAQAALPESWRVPSGTSPVAYADRGEAVSALATEARNLVQAVHAAEEFREWNAVVRLCQALWPLQLKAGHHDILLPALRIGVRTADTHFPGTRTAGALHAQLAHTLTELRRWDEAEPEALAAARDERAAGHARGHASAVEFLGLLRLRQWRWQEAYDCFEEAYGILDGIGPEDEGAGDLPRARALLERHRGRALRGLGRRDEARERLERALRFFRESGEAYNTARALTDLAETRLDGGEFARALPLIDEAIVALAKENAAYQLAHLRALRERCLNADGPQG
ncbi:MULTISPECIES: tetratricopeptide repeat protein [unclassified Streptomyces]|uniref:tetratricopeptide repeat protein n=1 Tax=unclassified Streptomyces TaxID=2593676 RepID=UPI002E8002E8|nr:tetratricopeptide repeat protein [Streptomyces sp. NBC_00589]WTI34723.1 tetratricopeptide repeat protein [Streptomyces sp. NBC_00775]WUB31603.1 tetratricopeptide repeat protein [Streptomyces sp. NBC_00589]